MLRRGYLMSSAYVANDRSGGSFSQSCWAGCAAAGTVAGGSAAGGGATSGCRWVSAAAGRPAVAAWAWVGAAAAGRAAVAAWAWVGASAAGRAVVGVRARVGGVDAARAAVAAAARDPSVATEVAAGWAPCGWPGVNRSPRTGTTALFPPEPDALRAGSSRVDRTGRVRVAGACWTSYKRVLVPSRGIRQSSGRFCRSADASRVSTATPLIITRTRTTVYASAFCPYSDWLN